MGPRRRLLLQEDMIPAFIQEVKNRECIWNPDHEQYNDRYEIIVAWKEIAQVMDQPEDVLRSKWKNLRDLFKREMKRWKKVDSVDSYKGRWKFFQNMWFINRPGDATNNDDDEVEDEVEEPVDKIFLEDEDDNPLEPFVKCEPPDSAEMVEYLVGPVSKKRKREKIDNDANDTDCDFDMMYLKSLTPYFRQLDPIRKLIVRSKIQDILINEIAVQMHANSKKNS